MIIISDDAQQFIADLLKKEQAKHADMAVRMEVIDADTPFAEAGIRFFVPEPEHMDDKILGFQGFQLYLDHKHLKLLEGTQVLLENDGLNKSLVMESPNLSPMEMVDMDAPLFERIIFTLETEVNPELANHGGMVRLVELTPDTEAVLQFGGGCQGCSMIDVTLKQGVEKMLRERFPELTGVVDATDHTSGENPYY